MELDVSGGDAAEAVAKLKEQPLPATVPTGSVILIESSL